jgi:NTP pyrophosphatase (non-canonical NTP hydrolase)
MEQFDLIRQWAEEKGIFDSSDAKTQYIKLQEEAGELAQSLLKKDPYATIDALGDCVVVLVNLAHLCGYKLEDCIESAYNEIKNRNGSMKYGAFVKQQN